MTRARSILSVACFGLLLSCLSPTLPLPPPALPSESASTTPGMVHLSSTRGADSNALIFVFNTNSSMPNDRKVGGAVADATGSWDTDVWATAGDTLWIWQEIGNDKSPYVTMTVH